jgi:nucleoside phosphorylase
MSRSGSRPIECVLLYTEEDPEIGQYIRLNFSNLDAMTGRRINIYTIEEPIHIHGSSYWKDHVERSVYSFLRIMGWTAYKPYCKADAYKIAEIMNIDPNELPCVVLYGDDLTDNIALHIEGKPAEFFRQFCSNIAPALDASESGSDFKFDSFKKGLLKRLPMVRRDRLSSASKNAVDIAIITIREDEYESIIDRLPDKTVLSAENRSYVIAPINHNTGSRYNVAVVRAPEQGPNAAHDTTRDVIADLDPMLIILAGIAGGIPGSEVTLGDVVVATRLHDFSVGALIEDASPEFTNQGGPMAKEVQDLVALLPAMKQSLAGWNDDASINMIRPSVDSSDHNFYGDADWRKRAKESLAKHFAEGARTVPLVASKAVASSGFLVKDSMVAGLWRKAARDIIAVEMELSGVYAAAFRMGRQYPVIAIRGVSDIVGFKRDDLWTRYACQSAGSFCVRLLHHLPTHFLRSGSTRPERAK